MANVNEVRLLGRLTRDPELRYTAGGTPVCEMGVAVNNFRKGQDGKRVAEPVFVDVTCWAKTAELANEYLSKGRQVYISGRLTFEQWTDKQSGAKRSKLKVIGDTLQFLDKKEEDQPGPNYEAQPEADYSKVPFDVEETPPWATD